MKNTFFEYQFVCTCAARPPPMALGSMPAARPSPTLGLGFGLARCIEEGSSKTPARRIEAEYSKP